MIVLKIMRVLGKKENDPKSEARFEGRSKTRALMPNLFLSVSIILNIQ